jgi:RNA polymerase sigma-70 factor (ECF subfamily)
VKKERGDIDVIAVWNQMKKGEEQCLSQIFTLYYSDLYHYGIKICNMPELVKDSIQDVFFRIWERRNFLGNVQSPKAYLISSLRRKLFVNKETPVGELSDQVIKAAEKDNFSFTDSEFLEIAEISSQLRKMIINSINALPEKQRELVFLRFYYGLRYHEIAQIMAVNEQTVKNLMQRTIANLRTKIDQRLWDGIDHIDDLLITLFYFFEKKV